ncbi:hypothetical protein GGR57DRAFT_479392 [Xylariaceae sp. FL1272]|nr:hypothetical protein GGR57DRAFT_479392 [Xylariaceae sp. FL1272]
MSHPHITAIAQLSATTLSFTSGPEPELTICLRLENAQKPITLSRRHQQLFIHFNALVFRDAITGKQIQLPITSVDANMKTVPQLRLSPETTSNFVSLQPGISCEISNIPFRPLGTRRKDTPVDPPKNSYEKYEVYKMGMHMLDVGREYTVEIRDDISVWSWMEGSLEELLREGKAWAPGEGQEPIKVVSAEGFRFKVEE